jgi:hypothetical protein
MLRSGSKLPRLGATRKKKKKKNNVIRMMKSRKNRLAGHVESMGGVSISCKTLFGKPRMSRPVGRHERGLQDNIKTGINLKIICGCALNSANIE